MREVACVNAPRTLLCADVGDSAKPQIALCAGVHGDEPAGPWALLGLLEDDALDRRYSYRVWPCTNPSGFRAGTRESADGADINRSFGRGGTTPEARAIVTSNRNRKFPLSIDLHEDCDAAGFYCYEYGGTDLGIAAVESVAAAGFVLEDLGPSFARGRMLPDPIAEADDIGGLSYTLAVIRHAAARALTFESPTRAPWDARLAMHRAAVCAVIAALPAVAD